MDEGCIADGATDAASGTSRMPATNTSRNTSSPRRSTWREEGRTRKARVSSPTENATSVTDSAMTAARDSWRSVVVTVRDDTGPGLAQPSSASSAAARTETTGQAPRVLFPRTLTVVRVATTCDDQNDAPASNPSSTSTGWVRWIPNPRP